MARETMESCSVGWRTQSGPFDGDGDRTATRAGAAMRFRGEAAAPRGDPSPALEAAEQALDDVAPGNKPVPARVPRRR